MAAHRGLSRLLPGRGPADLDEPTSALDARAEHAIFEMIREHSAGSTVLLITHRLASVRYADRIYVLDHGRVVEHGNHDTLLADGGLYAELYTLQAAQYVALQPHPLGLSSENRPNVMRPIATSPRSHGPSGVAASVRSDESMPLACWRGRWPD